jgi:hypothetical protein
MREQTMKLNQELAKIYYTAAEARHVLGIDEEAFQYWGRTERIKRIYLPGRKQAVYSKKEINKIASKQEATMLAEKMTGLEYRKATVNDLDAEVELASLVFGARASLPEAVSRRRSFIEKNPDTTYHLYDGDHLVAYINLFPFNQEAIAAFKEGTRGWLLGLDKLKQFTPDDPLECVMIDMVTTPTVPPARRGTYAQMLLEGFSRTLEDWGEKGIEITKVYAASNTPSGIRIIKHAGFQVIKEVSTGRFTFELDVETSETRMLIGYKEALKSWKDNKLSDTSRPKSRRSGKPLVQSVETRP